MRKALPLLAGLVLFSPVVLSAIGTIKEVRLAAGYDDVNRITSPLFEAGAVRPISFGIRASHDRGAKIVRRGATSMFTRGPEYNLDKAVDLGALLTDALTSEARALGFGVASSSGAAWSVEGSLKDVYLESKQIPYGATLFYGYMDVELQVKGSEAASQPRRWRLHNYFGGYNAGMGRKDEAEEALAHLLVEGAQEVVARLNREVFKAPLHSSSASRAAALAGPASPSAADLYRIGLSGSADAVGPLLRLLTSETDENRRSVIIDALARLAPSEAIDVLASRYSAEDEDCRWYTLKAMDYIGSPAALALVKEHGLKDKDGGPRRLAERILKGA